MTRRATWRVILGPCHCQGCGEPVAYVRAGHREGWLHETGWLRCSANEYTRRRRRAYKAEWMRRHRAA